jgi:hypothetical protein
VGSILTKKWCAALLYLSSVSISRLKAQVMGSACPLPHFAVPAAARQAGAASIGTHRASSCSAGLGAGERWAGGRIEFVDGDDAEAAPPAAVTPDAVEPPPSGPALDAGAATPAAEAAAVRPPLGAAAAGAARRQASAAAADSAAALAGVKWKKLAGRALAEVRERSGSWAAVRCAFCSCAPRLLGCFGSDGPGSSTCSRPEGVGTL